MLPAAQRLRQPALFRDTVRRGRRAGSASLTVHWLSQDRTPGDSAADEPLRIGLVVSKAVGNAVTRNLVKRRLRHLCREQLDALPAAGVLVLRALPAAGTASARELRADLARCLERVMS